VGVTNPPIVKNDPVASPAATKIGFSLSVRITAAPSEGV